VLEVEGGADSGVVELGVNELGLVSVEPGVEELGNDELLSVTVGMVGLRDEELGIEEVSDDGTCEEELGDKVLVVLVVMKVSDGVELAEVPVTVGFVIVSLDGIDKDDAELDEGTEDVKFDQDVVDRDSVRGVEVAGELDVVDEGTDDDESDSDVLDTDPVDGTDDDEFDSGVLDRDPVDGTDDDGLSDGCVVGPKGRVVDEITVDEMFEADVLDSVKLNGSVTGNVELAS
jgi:hypothetical protein